MATKLDDLIARVRAELLRADSARWADVQHLVGVGRMKEHCAPVRVNWVRSSMKVLPPKSVGNVTVEEARKARPIAEVFESVEVYLFAKTDEEAEVRFADFVRAAWTVLSTPLQGDPFDGEAEWFEESGASGVSARAACIRIPLRFPWSVFGAPQTVLRPGFSTQLTLNGESNG